MRSDSVRGAWSDPPVRPPPRDACFHLAVDDPQTGTLEEGLEAVSPQPILVGGLGNEADLGVHEHADDLEEHLDGSPRQRIAGRRLKPGPAVCAMP